MRVKFRGKTYQLNALAPLNAFLDGVFWALGAVLVIFIVFGLAKPASAAEISIPQEAYKYRSVLIRAAHSELGLNAPVALLAAQVHQESLWRTGATSSAGAQGLAQFMPATAHWLPQVAPHTGEPLPFNPGWALTAMCAYDGWIFNKLKAKSPFEQWAFTLSAYNGGLGWVQRDQRLAAAQGYAPERWFEHVELVNAGRSKANFQENRGYPRRILLVLMPLYQQAGWGVGVSHD